MDIVDCSIKVHDNIIEIIPNEGVKDNSIYEIKLKNIKSISGTKVLEKEKVSICTALSPSYCSLEDVKSLISACDIPNKEILLKIREASNFADYLRQGVSTTTTYVNNTDIMIPAIKDQVTVRDPWGFDQQGDNQVAESIPFEITQFTKYWAAKECLIKFYIGKTVVSGEKGQLGDISFEHGSKIPDITKLLSEIQSQIDFWKDGVRGYGVEGRAKPKSTIQARNAIPLDLSSINSLSSVHLDYNRGV